MCVREEWSMWEMASSVDLLGKLKRVQGNRDGGANVALNKSLKNLHDYWYEGNWTIVIQARGFTVLRHRDDDRFFCGGGNHRGSKGLIKDRSEQTSKLIYISIYLNLYYGYILWKIMEKSFALYSNILFSGLILNLILLFAFNVVCFVYMTAWCRWYRAVIGWQRRPRWIYRDANASMTSFLTCHYLSFQSEMSRCTACFFFH